MTTRPRTVRPDASIREIAELMLEEDVGVVPVVEADGRLSGIVTDRDIVIRGLVKGRSVEACTARDVATTNLEVASTHDSLSEVIELMGRERVRRVPVLDDDDKLVGILAMADIASRADYSEDLQHALQKISGRRSFWSRIWR
jgi:CBS domain-containing protein